MAFSQSNKEEEGASQRKSGLFRGGAYRREGVFGCFFLLTFSIPVSYVFLKLLES